MFFCLRLSCLLHQSLEAGRQTTAAVLRLWAHQVAKLPRYHPLQAISFSFLHFKKSDIWTVVAKWPHVDRQWSPLKRKATFKHKIERCNVRQAKGERLQSSLNSVPWPYSKDQISVAHNVWFVVRDVH